MMRTVGRYTLGLLFLALMIELVLIGPLDIKEDKPVSRATPIKGPGLDPEVEQLMQGIHVIEAKNERKEWELWADNAVGFRDKDDMSLKKVKAQFFTTGGVTFDVVGAEGSVKTENKNIVVDGNVVTTSSNGYVFKTDRVEYNSKARFLKSPGAVEVSGPRDQGGKGLYLKGNKMAADLNTGYVLLEDKILAKKTIRENQNLAVSSQQAKLSGSEKSVRFTGQVVIDLNGVRISGPDALFKYGVESDLLETIELEGGVRVSDFSKWATSEKLSINLAKNQFIFDGKPRVVQDNDEIRGDRIVFLDGGKKVKVQNAKVKVSRQSINQGVVDKQSREKEKVGNP